MSTPAAPELRAAVLIRMPFSSITNDLSVRPLSSAAGDACFACAAPAHASAIASTHAAIASALFLTGVWHYSTIKAGLAIAPSRPDTIYALAASNDPGPGGNYQQGLLAVFRSDAGGMAGSSGNRISRVSPTLRFAQAAPSKVDVFLFPRRADCGGEKHPFQSPRPFSRQPKS